MMLIMLSQLKEKLKDHFDSTLFLDTLEANKIPYFPAILASNSMASDALRKIQDEGWEVDHAVVLFIDDVEPEMGFSIKGTQSGWSIIMKVDLTDLIKIIQKTNKMKVFL